MIDLEKNLATVVKQHWILAGESGPEDVYIDPKDKRLQTYKKKPKK